MFDMHTDMHKAGTGRRLFARMMETLGRHFGGASEGETAQFPKPGTSGKCLEPLPTDALVRPSMHHRVTIQTHHEDWP
jgi:hypothetical protein